MVVQYEKEEKNLPVSDRNREIGMRTANIRCDLNKVFYLIELMCTDLDSLSGASVEVKGTADRVFSGDGSCSSLITSARYTAGQGT